MNGIIEKATIQTLDLEKSVQRTNTDFKIAERIFYETFAIPEPDPIEE